MVLSQPHAGASMLVCLAAAAQTIYRSSLNQKIAPGISMSYYDVDQLRTLLSSSLEWEQGRLWTRGALLCENSKKVEGLEFSIFYQLH